MSPDDVAAPVPLTAPRPPGVRPSVSWPLPRRHGSYLTGTAGPHRLVGLDAARGLAMLGMMAAHVGHTTCGFTTLIGALHVTHGRSSILFAVIAGFSLGIISGREHPHDGERLVHTRLRILTRSALLLVVAAVLETFQTPVAIIIGFYAAWLALAIPFLRWRPSRLFLAAGATAVIGPVVNLNLVSVLGTVGLTLTPMWGQSANGALLEFFFTGMYPGVTWMAFILLGLGLSRLNWSTWQQMTRLVGVGLVCAVIGYGGGWAVASALAPQMRPSFVWVTPDDELNCYLPAASVKEDTGGSGTGADEFRSSDGPLSAPWELADGGAGLAETDSTSEGGVGWPGKKPPNGGVGQVGDESSGASEAAGASDTVDETAEASGAADGGSGRASDGSGEVGNGSSGSPSDSSSQTWPDTSWSSETEEWVDGPQWSPGRQSWISPEALLSLEPHSGTPFEAVGGAGVAMALIGLCLLIARAVRGRGRWVLSPLAAVGSMSLTVYCGHIVAIWVLGVDGLSTRGNGMLGWMALGFTTFAMAWFTVFARGPLEHLVHVVSVRATRADNSTRMSMDVRRTHPDARL